MRIFLLVLMLIGANAFAITPKTPVRYFSSGSAFDLDRIHPAARKWNLGTMLRQEGTAVATYDFTKDGGATGTYTFPLTLPSGAIVKRVFFHSQITASSAGAGTMAWTLQSAGDLKSALAAGSWSGIVAGVPDNTTSNMIVLTANRTLTMAIATAAFTAGKIHAIIEYVYPRQ